MGFFGIDSTKTSASDERITATDQAIVGRGPVAAGGSISFSAGKKSNVVLPGAVQASGQATVLAPGSFLLRDNATLNTGVPPDIFQSTLSSITTASQQQGATL